MALKKSEFCATVWSCSNDSNNITTTGDKTEKVDRLISEIRDKISDKKNKKI